MKKRTIFFFSYILFFILVPSCVYFFWPIPADSIGQLIPQQNSGLTYEDGAMEADLATGSDTTQFTDSISQNYFDQLNKVVERAFRFLNADVAILSCFFLSVLTAFFLSLNKFLRPENDTARIIKWILIFNVLYLPIYFMLLIFNIQLLGIYYVWFIIDMLAKPVCLIVILLVFLLFIASITLVRKGEKRKRELIAGEEMKSE